MEKEREKGNVEAVDLPIRFDKDKFKAWIRRDFFYILLLLFALFACIYTWDTVDDVNNACNIHWQEQFKRCSCMCLGEWEDVTFDGIIGNNTYLEPKNYTLEDTDNGIKD